MLAGRWYWGCQQGGGLVVLGMSVEGGTCGIGGVRRGWTGGIRVSVGVRWSGAEGKLSLGYCRGVDESVGGG